MASLSLYPQFETNLMSNRKVIKLLQLKSTKAHGKNYMKVRPPLVRHLLRNRLLSPGMISKKKDFFSENYSDWNFKFLS